MENPKLNINKTKYRYFMDNVKPEGTANFTVLVFFITDAHVGLFFSG